MQSQDDLWLEASVKFRKVTWNELEPGDVLYYQMRRQGVYDEHHAHGPVLVVDPVEGIIQNSQGVKIKALDWNVNFLKVDLISILSGA